MLPARHAIFLFTLLLTFLPVTSRAACPILDDTTASNRINTLSANIHYHNRLYYQEQRSEISDAAFDRLRSELTQLEACFPHLCAANSPVKMIDGEEVGPLSLRHESAMLGLNSSSDAETVQALLKRTDKLQADVVYTVEPKVDGLPLELCYEKGVLISAATRGDGRIGNDVTTRARSIRGIPNRLTPPFPNRLVLRGEVYADLAAFRALPDDQDYATPRHLAAATLRSTSPVPAALAALRFFPFEVISATPDLPGSSNLSRLKQLSAWGLPVETSWTSSAQTLADIRRAYRRLLAQRETLPFAVDGIVVKIDTPKLRRQLGAGSRAPLWAAAWKFPPATARTTVTAINWSTGRSGRQTPVAEVAPVKIGGVQVRRASLHGAAQIARLNLLVGDEVIVALAGDIIPQIIDVIDKPTNPDAAVLVAQPLAMDACLTFTPLCREQFLARAEHFCGKQGLAIGGLGPKRLAGLVDTGQISDLPSILELESGTLAAISGVGLLQAEEMAATIRSARRSPPHRLLAAVGVPGVGRQTCAALEGRFDTLAALVANDPQQLASISGVSVNAADNIQTFFRTTGGRRLLKRLHDLELD